MITWFCFPIQFVEHLWKEVEVLILLKNYICCSSENLQQLFSIFYAHASLRNIGAMNLSARLRVTHSAFCRLFPQLTTTSSSYNATRNAGQNVEEALTHLKSTIIGCCTPKVKLPSPKKPCCREKS